MAENNFVKKLIPTYFPFIGVRNVRDCSIEGECSQIGNQSDIVLIIVNVRGNVARHLQPTGEL